MATLDLFGDLPGDGEAVRGEGRAPGPSPTPYEGPVGGGHVAGAEAKPEDSVLDLLSFKGGRGAGLVAPGDRCSEPGLPQVWTVSEVNAAVRALLEEMLPPLWVVGEVASWTRARSGHCYFTLKDETAQLRCVLWRGEAARLPVDPEVGMRIRVFGQLTLYEARGDYQMVARVLEGEGGEGIWKLAFERLRRRLEEEGLLAPGRKRPLPRFPRSVGVVTSRTGAALYDILTVLKKRAPWIRVVVRDTPVQGEGAALGIARALEVLGHSGLAEVIIVGRGGGSLEDLWAFNEEPVARAIAGCPVPVISAVGHEVDVTLSDLVADWRAPTPSAAAEVVAPDVREIVRYLEGLAGRLAGGLRARLQACRRSTSRARERLVRLSRQAVARERMRTERLLGPLLRAGSRLLGPRRRRWEEARRRLEVSLRDLLLSYRSQLARLGAQMDALSPLATLRRGYAVALGLKGQVLRRVVDFVEGGEFHLRVVDGRVRALSMGPVVDP